MAFLDRRPQLPATVVFFLMLGLVWSLRLLQPKSSFPGFSSDYAAHMAIAFELYLNPAQLMAWPLPYWGIVLSHVMTWPLLALGMDISRAMLLVLDLSVVSTVFALILTVRRLGRPDWERRVLYLLVAIVTVPGMMSMAAGGFYSQVVSWMFYVPFLALVLVCGLHSLGDLLLGAGLLLLGTLCYPDAFLWFAPLWIFSAFSAPAYSKLLRVAAVGFIGAWFILLSGQIRVMGQDGGGGRGFEFPLLAVAIWAILLLGQKPEPGSFQQRFRSFFFVHAGLVLGLSLYSYLEHGEVLYYARKNVYAAYYVFPFLAMYGLSLVNAVSSSRGYMLVGSFVFAMGLPQFLQGSFSEMYDYLLRARGPISLEDRNYVRAQRAASICQPPQRLVLVPPESARSAHNLLGPRIPRLVYFNLGVGLLDISKSSLTWTEGTQGLIAAAETWQEKQSSLSGSQRCLSQD
jgi:hypothetical protein